MFLARRSAEQLAGRPRLATGEIQCGRDEHGGKAGDGSVVCRGESRHLHHMTGTQPETLEPDSLDERPPRPSGVGRTHAARGVSRHLLVYAFVKKDSLLWMIDLHVYRSGGDIALHSGALYDSLVGARPSIHLHAVRRVIFAATSFVPLGVAQGFIVVGTFARGRGDGVARVRQGLRLPAAATVDLDVRRVQRWRSGWSPSSRRSRSGRSTRS